MKKLLIKNLPEGGQFYKYIENLSIKRYIIILLVAFIISVSSSFAYFSWGALLILILLLQ